MDRYFICSDSEYHGIEAEKCIEGYWVKYNDHLAETAELKETFKGCNKTARQIKMDALREMMECINKQYPKIKNLSVYTKSDIEAYVTNQLEKNDE